MSGPRASRRPPRGLVAAATLAAVALVAGLASAADPALGRHGDHGRFSAQAQGFPPQPVDLVGARGITPRPLADPVRDAAPAVAATDPAVAAALGTDPLLIGVEDVTPKGTAQGAHRVTWWVPASRASALATVVDGAVVDLEVVPGTTWQPPLTLVEEGQAEALARQALLAAGHDSVRELEGFTIPAMDPDGGWPASRLAYVSFHAHVDARPQLVAWVDLSAGAVTQVRVEPPGRSPAAPRRATAAGFAQGLGPATPREGAVTWRGWSFDYAVSGRMDGVSLSDVSWQGVDVVARASMPAMTVFYDDDACGPFVDRLGGDLTPVPWAGDAEVVLREFTQLGEDWLELGILDTIGNYVLYQVFYLSADGELDLHTFAKGVQCTVDHRHFPFWRLDVDVAGPLGDQITRATPAGPQVQASEFDADAGDALDHGWSVRDATTGHRVDVRFDDGSWNVPGQVLPRATSDANRIHGRRFSDADAGPWVEEARSELGGNQGRSLDGQDVVLWYRGFLPHADAEGPDLWHSTGVRLTVELARDHYVRQR